MKIDQNQKSKWVVERKFPHQLIHNRNEKTKFDDIVDRHPKLNQYNWEHLINTFHYMMIQYQF